MEASEKLKDEELAKLFNRVGPVVVNARPGHWHLHVVDMRECAYEGPTIKSVLKLMIEDEAEIIAQWRERRFDR